MKPFRIVLVLLLAACFSCSKKSDVYRQLVEVDSLLLEHNLDDTAAMLLRGIEPETQEDTAYYNILNAAAEYDHDWKIKSIEPLNFSIGYYTKNYDNEKLAYAYYYKAIYYVCQNKYNEDVVVLLKNAENHAGDTKNLRLLNRIYSVLAIVNGTKGEYDEALKYSDKECTTAKMMDDDYCVVYAYISRSTTYKAMQCYDSSEHYIKKCESLADNIDSISKGFFFNRLGECFIQTNPAKAKEYFYEALKYSKLPDIYANLANIYYKECQDETAERYCDSALVNASYTVKKEIFTLMAEKSYENKNIEKYKQATDRLIASLREEMAYNKNNRTLELQQKYDLDLYQQKIRSRVINTSLAGILLVAVMVLLHRIRVRRVENKRIKAELEYGKAKNTLALLEERIAALESERKSKTKELSVLKEKAENLKNEMQANLQHGHDLYDKLKRNESPAQWTDNDYLCLFDFVSTINKRFVDSLDVDYDQLSNDQKLFQIIDILMDKDDSELCQMLCLEKQSLRNKRNRIEKKRIVPA